MLLLYNKTKSIPVVEDQESVHETWMANFVRRWHSNAHMNHTTDYISAHSNRMATLILKLWPDCSKELLAAVITHDLGERRVGDFPYDFKKKNPSLAREIGEMESAAREAFMGIDWEAQLTEEEYKKFKLVDRLDSHLFMLLHNPALHPTKPWQDQLEADFDKAEELGVFDEIEQLILDAEDFIYGNE